MRHHIGVCFRDDALPAAASGTAQGGERGASDSVHSCRAVSLQRFDDHNRVTQELERARTCMAAKLMQAACEIATQKSKVLSNSVSVRARLRSLGIDFASGKRVTPAVRRARLEKSKGACKADQENPRQIVGAVAATAGADCACLLDSMKRCSSPGRRWRLAWRSGSMAGAQQWCS